MRLIDLLEKRRKDKQKRYEQLLEKEYKLREKKLDARKDLAEKVTPCVDGPNLSFDGISSDTEPFAWPKGTVRGIITLWVVLTFCVICMWNFMLNLNIIPMEWFLGIVGLVIGSYFYTRLRMVM